MKTKFKKNGRRLLAAILCLVMAVMALPMSAFAWTSEEGVSCTSSFGDYYVGSDGEYYRSKSSYSFIVYDSDGNTSVRTISAGNAKRKYLMTDSSGTHQVYCVESGIDFNTGNSYVSQNGKNSSYFRKLPTEAQFGVMMALMYGWHEGKSSPVAGTNTDDYAFATQTIIWEYQQQLRTSPSDLHSANGIDADTYRYSLKGRPAEKCYDWILSQMASHYTIPSFAARNQNKADTYTPSLRRVSMEEANAFLSVKLRTAKTIAYAAFLCIVSPIALLILGAISESTVGVLNENIAGGIGMIVLIILVAIAAVMFISSGSKTAPFAYLEKEKFETEYGVSGMVKERKAQYKDLHTKHNIAGACLCVTALIPLFVGAIIDADNDLFLTIMLSLSFLIAGVGVICFIKTGIIWASYEKLLQEGEYSKENKEKPSFSGAIYTAYWVIATAVYLGYSLSSNNWGQSWIIWVVAGVIFPAVIAITNAFEKKSK